MYAIVIRFKPAPPVPADAVRRQTFQHLRERALSGVHKAHGYMMPSGLQGESEVAIVRQNDRSIDTTPEDIHKEVGGDVHVGALLLE